MQIICLSVRIYKQFPPTKAEKNQKYKRDELHQKYSGQQQRGISTPSDYPIIFIFSSQRGEEYGYDDHWTEEGIFVYTGEGQEGDMEFISGNKAIRDHMKNRESIFLFEKEEPNIYRFIDEMIYLDHEFDVGLDKNGEERRIIQFKLGRVSELDLDMEDEIKTSESQSLNDLRKNAIASSSASSNATERKVKARERSQKIKEYALKRADGKCEFCEENAPFFNSKGEPYLEVHHLEKLSDSGPDHPEWVAALCPNCHRESHYGRNKENINDILKEKVQDKENNMEEE